MISQTGISSSIQPKALQSSGQAQELQQGAQQPEKKAEDNKVQESRSAEVSNTQETNGSGRDLQQVADTILANQNDGPEGVTSSVERGQVIDITI